MNDIMSLVEKDYLKESIQAFNPGDTIKVYLKLIEGEKERIQIFEGIVIGKKHSSVRETFIVRKICYGVGVERIFALNSPLIQKIEIVIKGKVKRAKLYYLRKRIGKKATRVKRDQNI
ncbi:MAG: 50S ribosomal protein L19 [bacterium]